MTQTLNEVPSLENKKAFLVFDGAHTQENFLFQGTIIMFQDCFFYANDWNAVKGWAADSGYNLVTEDDADYANLVEMVSEYDTQSDFCDTDSNQFDGEISDFINQL